MSRLRAPLLSGVIALGAALPAAAQAPRPVEVTSDSAAYCQHLASRIMDERRRVPSAEPEVDTLLQRGQQLCAAGRVRPGLNRLRHALLELREHTGD